MEIKTNHIGINTEGKSSIIEVIISSDGATIKEDVTLVNGEVDDSFIQDLREVANELEAQNNIVRKK